jgi:hypothetical protein
MRRLYHRKIENQVTNCNAGTGPWIRPSAENAERKVLNRERAIRGIGGVYKTSLGLAFLCVHALAQSISAAGCGL